MKLTERYTGSMNDERSELSAKQRAKLLRSILENTELKRVERLQQASALLNLHGVEYIPSGKNQKSPAIDYVNSGDTYDVTLMYVHYRGFKVGSWGDIVERGNYA
jgi:hypothetical protein